MSHRAINWTITALFALVMSSAHLLDGPSEIEAAQAVAADLDDAIKGARTAQAEVKP